MLSIQILTKNIIANYRKLGCPPGVPKAFVVWNITHEGFLGTTSFRNDLDEKHSNVILKSCQLTETEFFHDIFSKFSIGFFEVVVFTFHVYKFPP